MTPRRLPAAFLLGMLLATTPSCDDEPPPPNRCVEFLECYAGCRSQYFDELPGTSPNDGSEAAMDHLRCHDECGGYEIEGLDIHRLYPLTNEMGWTWPWIDACFAGVWE